MLSKDRREEIGRFILQNVSAHPNDITTLTKTTFCISRQAAYQYIRNMVKHGVLVAAGSTRDRRYSLAKIAGSAFEIPVTPDLQEDLVWRDRVKPLLEGVPENIMGICVHGFTEMLNNVIDHSQAATVEVHIERTAAELTMCIRDNGVGIFNKVARSLNLADPRESLLELSKGKFTTDPQNHSGQGIFFTSRMFDSFYIFSGNLSFAHRESTDDWLLEDVAEEQKGTAIVMRISSFSNRTAKEIFDKYSTGEDYGFTRTHVPIALAKYGEANLVSRSQAKRVLAGVDRFAEVLLDFAKVESVGQAFADEIFRVFARQHPAISLRWINTNEQISQMIWRAKSSPSQDKTPPPGTPKAGSTQGTITQSDASRDTTTGNVVYGPEHP